MPKAKQQLESALLALEENTVIYKVDKALLRKYVQLHKVGKDEAAKGSLNDYLQATVGKDPQYKGKVLIAEIRDLSFDSPDVVEEHSYASILHIEGADLTGSRLVNVAFYNIHMSKTKFRDCQFEHITFWRSDMRGSDMRGVRLRDVNFAEYSQNTAHLLEGLHLAYSDVDKVAKLGAMEIEDSLIHGLYCGKLDDKFERELKERTAKFTKANRKQQSWGSWGTEFVVTLEFSKEEEREIAKIEEQLKEEHRVLKEKHRVDHCIIKIPNPKTDPTYIPKESGELADAHKLRIKVSKKDLAEYRDKKGDFRCFRSFVEYKYADQIAEASADLDPGRKVVVVPDLSHQNLKGFNFTSLNVEGVDFSYANLSKCKFTRAKLCGSSLEGAKIERTKFKEAYLIDCNMVGIAGQGVNFENAIMLRVRMDSAKVESGIFDGAFMYASDISAADFSHSSMQHVNLEKSIAHQVNLSYVDARYAKFREADLTESILKETDFSHANLKKSVMARADAMGADFTSTLMDGVNAEYAKFNQAIMDEVSAKDGNFTEADMSDLLSAREADFTKAIMKKVKAHRANFADAILEGVQAQEADFMEATLDRVKAERFDISGGILRSVKARNAHLKGAIIEGSDARHADFTKAMMEDIRAHRANLGKAILEEANLRNADLRAANLRRANLKRAELEKARIDHETMLAEAELEGARHAEAFRVQKSLHDKLYGSTIPRSAYGRCKNNSDGTNDRFTTQQLGARVLVAAMGVGGYTLAGPLGGMSAVVAGGLVSEQMLEWAKDDDPNHSHIDNVIGDKLAEVGVIAQSAGLDGFKGATYATVAASIASSVGLVQGSLALGGGILATVGGAAIAIDGHKKGSKNQTIIGVAMAAMGATVAAIGASMNTAAISFVAYSGFYGGVAGAFYGAMRTIKDLRNNKKPEDIYRENNREFSKFWGMIKPSWKKIIGGVVIGAAVAVIGVLLAKLILPKLAVAALTTTIFSIGSGVGFVAGYVGTHKLTKAKELELPTNKDSKQGKTHIKKKIKSKVRDIDTPEIDKIPELAELVAHLRDGGISEKPKQATPKDQASEQEKPKEKTKWTRRVKSKKIQKGKKQLKQKEALKSWSGKAQAEKEAGKATKAKHRPKGAGWKKRRMAEKGATQEVEKSKG